MNIAASKRDKRVRLVEAAIELIHRQGFDQTALADIAKSAKVPLGNVYYYFKTKAQIGEAVIERRQLQFRMLCEQWEQGGGARERLIAYVEMTLAGREAVARWGCPIGTLCSELEKRGGPLARKAAVVFVEVLAWMEEQFRALDQPDPGGCALHLLSAMQGASVLAHTLHDPDVLAREAARIREWLRGLC